MEPLLVIILALPVILVAIGFTLGYLWRRERKEGLGFRSERNRSEGRER